MGVAERIDALDREIETYKEVIKDARDALHSAELELYEVLDTNSELPD